MTKAFLCRASAVAIGFMLLGSVATAAVAAEQIGDDDAVDLRVEIEDLTTPGALSMSVAGTELSLEEQAPAAGETSAVRSFTGTLPTVTVTDTRDAEDIPAGAFWYVLGSATAFVADADQDPITPDHLGWTPDVSDPEGTGEVAAGPEVDTVLDGPPNNVGLVDQELLAISNDSAASVGSWEADAELVLKVPSTTDAGEYSSTLTLSLFE